MTSNTFRDLVRGDASLEQAVRLGRIVLYGEQAGIQRLESLMKVGSGGSGSAGPDGTSS
jgi:hypothetical protein